MRYQYYPPIRTHTHENKLHKCVVELTPQDVSKAVCLLAASREEYLPRGRVTVKTGKKDGVTIVEILFDPEETE